MVAAEILRKQFVLVRDTRSYSGEVAVTPLFFFSLSFILFFFWPKKIFDMPEKERIYFILFYPHKVTYQ